MLIALIELKNYPDMYQISILQQKFQNGLGKLIQLYWTAELKANGNYNICSSLDPDFFQS